MSLDKKLSLKVVNNKIQVIENYINEILIELDYTAKNLLLISYLNFKISSEGKFEKEIKNNNNKGVIYSEIIDLFTKIFEEEKINLNLNGYGNLINNKFYFRKFPKDSQIKNVLRIYDNFGINEIGKAIDIDRKYEEVFLKFKKENHEDYEPTIKDFFDFLLKDIKK